MGSFRHPGSKGEAFSKQATLSVEGMLGTMNKVIQETTIELYARAVIKTPIKETDAINSWGVSVNTPDGANKLIVMDNHEKASVGQQISSVIKDTKLRDNYFLKNDIYYILLLENGGYDGIPIHRNDPYPPWYPESRYPRPFTLLTSGRGGPISKKAPKGMVKVTMLESDDVFRDMSTKYGSK